MNLYIQVLFNSHVTNLLYILHYAFYTFFAKYIKYFIVFDAIEQGFFFIS